MKIIFLGTPSIALEVLDALLKNHEVVSVITQPDKSQGRSKELVSSPVAQLIENHNISSKKDIILYKTGKIDEDMIDSLRNLKADIFVTFAFGVILKKEFFTIAPLGGINIHPSLLPEYRGPSPIQSALRDGKTRTGITVQSIKLKIDSGEILKQVELDILPEDDAITMEEKISSISKSMILDVLDDLENNRISPVIQDESKVTYCKMIRKTDGLINWNDNASVISNRVRAFVKWPVCHSFIDGKKINIYKCRITEPADKEMFTKFQNGVIVTADKNSGITVKCNDSYINIEKLQMQGKKVLDWKSFLNGNNLTGKKFTNGEA
jgi:methionyl-tRNA formyltransferase